MMQSTKLKNHSKGIKIEDNYRAKTPVIVVAYPNGYPRGLHLFGNRNSSKKQMSDNSDQSKQDSKKNNKAPTTLTKVVPNNKENSRNGGGSKSRDDSIMLTLEKQVSEKVKELIQRNKDHMFSQLGASSLILRGDKAMSSRDSPEYHLRYGRFPQAILGDLSSKRTKEYSASLKNTTPQNEQQRKLSKLSQSSKSSSISSCPWRTVGAFQTPAAHRRKTFYNFNMMTPDPPKTPINQSHSQHHQDAMSDPKQYKSKGLFKEESKRINLHSKKSNHELLFQTEMSSLGPSSNGHNLSKNKIRSTTGKSFTGLSLASRLKVSNTIKKTPSMILLSAHNRQMRQRDQSKTQQVATPTSHHHQGPPLTSKRSLVTVSGSSGSALKWVPTPPSKRFEQVRLMNHIIRGYGHSNMGHREKYLYQTSQGRHKGPQTKQSQFQSQKLKVPGSQPQYHVSAPGPKRENIYIGQYDGSDSDSSPEPADDNNGKTDKTNEKEPKHFAQLD